MEKTWPITEIEEIKRLQTEIDTLHHERLEVEKQVRAIADLAIAIRHSGQLDAIRGLATDLIIRMIRRRNHDKVPSSSGTPNRI